MANEAAGNSSEALAGALSLRLGVLVKTFSHGDA
jgi:hypothetical protein